MVINSRFHCLVAIMIAAFVVSGCQSTNKKWATAWKERSKSKPQFQGLEGSEEITYWPYKPGKDKKKMSALPSPLQDKLARNSENSKNSQQLSELIKEGDQLRKNSQYEDARLVYNKALSLSPESPDVNHRLAIIADKQHQYSAADQYYQAALRSRPRDVNLLSDLGYSYSLRGNVQQAEQTLKDALAIDPSHKGTMSNLGSLFAQQNRYPEALDMFRRGTTEAEAQQYIAKLFPQGRAAGDAMAMLDRGHSPMNSATGIVAAAAEVDIGKMSFEQIQAEMARVKLEAKSRREQEYQNEQIRLQNLAAETERMERLQAQQQRMVQSNSRGNFAGGPVTLGPQTLGAQSHSATNPQTNMKNPAGLDRSAGAVDFASQAGSNTPNQAMNVPANASPIETASQDRSTRAAATAPAKTEFFLGSPSQPRPIRQADNQVQNAWGQMSNSMPNAIQQANASNPASQMATQLGMSAGPGSMFPIMSGNNAVGNNNVGSNGDSTAPASTIGTQDNRFGNGMLQPSLNSGPLTHPDRLTEPTTNSSAFDRNWSQPSTGAAQWPVDSVNSTSWSADISQPAAGAAKRSDSTSGNSSSWGQNVNRTTEASGSNWDGSNSSTSRQGSDSSRPYNGAWPNSNSLPARENLNATSIGRAPESLEMMSINPRNRAGSEGAGDANANNPNSNSAERTVPAWPYAPNR